MPSLLCLYLLHPCEWPLCPSGSSGRRPRAIGFALTSFSPTSHPSASASPVAHTFKACPGTTAPLASTACSSHGNFCNCLLTRSLLPPSRTPLCLCITHFFTALSMMSYFIHGKKPEFLKCLPCATHFSHPFLLQFLLYSPSSSDTRFAQALCTGCWLIPGVSAPSVPASMFHSVLPGKGTNHTNSVEPHPISIQPHLCCDSWLHNSLVHCLLLGM